MFWQGGFVLDMGVHFIAGLRMVRFYPISLRNEIWFSYLLQVFYKFINLLTFLNSTSLVIWKQADIVYRKLSTGLLFFGPQMIYATTFQRA